MSNSMLVKKLNILCPLCDKTHDVEERKETVIFECNGEKVAYEEHFYFCENTPDQENTWYPGALWVENLNRAHKAWRKQQDE